jgi:hypothetical protein
MGFTQFINILMRLCITNVYKLFKGKIGMERNRGLTDREKELLNVIGRNPESSLKEVTKRCSYQWETTISRKLTQFKEQGILFGPIYQTDYGKLCKNPLHGIICILEFNQSYDTVMSYLRCIETVLSMYPILSSRKKALLVEFLSSDNRETESLLKLLKDNNIITHFIIRVFTSMPVRENPNFLGNPNPLLDQLLAQCDIPDMSFGVYDTAWNQCDISILPYLERGAKLIDVLREEKKANRTWTYEQVRYSRDKMVENGLIKKVYQFSPFPHDQCTTFFLFLKAGEPALTKRILCNFAREERVYREYALCGKWGGLAIISHPLFLTDLLIKLEKTEEITEIELYPFRYISPRKSYVSYLREYRYFDGDTQTLYYPYYVYKEKIKEKIKNELAG